MKAKALGPGAMSGVDPVAVTSSPAEWRLRIASDQYINKLSGARRMRAQAEAIWHAWPQLLRVAMRLVEHVGPTFPGRQTHLVDEVLVAAVDAYADAAERMNRDGAAAAFLRTLTHAADWIQARQLVGVVAGGDLVPWPHFEMGIGAWLDAASPSRLELQVAPYLGVIEVTGGRDFLAHRLMDHREYGLMKLGLVEERVLP